MQETVSFVPEQEYVRAELHKRFGGQHQYGISTPAENPLIFLFPGPSGPVYGYEDGWTAEGLYRYSGEGQVGDMKMTGGNKAIREHAETGRDLHLFENVGGGRARYEGHMVYVAEEWSRGPDKNGEERKVVQFLLAPIEEFQANETKPIEAASEEELEEAPLDELRTAATADSSTEWVEIEQRRKLVRRRSAAIRLYALKRAAGVCESCSQQAPFVTPKGKPFLEVHHLRRLGDGGPDHPEWVAAVCPNCHRQAHYGNDARSFNDSIINRIHELEG